MSETRKPDPETFLNHLDGIQWDDVSDIAVAVSGGPDSMALLGLLVNSPYTFQVHALIVDHGLREEAAAEAERVREQIESWPRVSAHILQWAGEKPDAAVQEEARNARYGLMAEYCRAHRVRYLFLGHHQDDQAETVLFRLAKGSGLDGLAGMRPVQVYDDAVSLVRPLLDVPKSALIEMCEAHGVGYVEDPSNANEQYARVRLRQSADILAEEGLSAKRLANTAKRINRAREALDFFAEKAQKDCVLVSNTKRIEYNYKLLRDYPDEVVLRCVMAAFVHFNPDADYAPRMEKVEALLDDLIGEESFRKRTLGGVVFERDDENQRLILAAEERA